MLLYAQLGQAILANIVSTTHLTPMKVKELLDRYNLKTRQSLYDRLKALSIVLEKDESGHGYATPDQLDRLDQLDEHLKSTGATLSNFTPVSEVSSMSEDSTLDVVYPSLDSTQLLVNILEQIEHHLARLNPTNPLLHHEILEKASSSGWILSTSEVANLIGTKPRGEQFVRGCWVFHKVGKVGNQSGWKVFRP